LAGLSQGFLLSHRISRNFKTVRIMDEAVHDGVEDRRLSGHFESESLAGFNWNMQLQVLLKNSEKKRKLAQLFRLKICG
jgi:predicted TIM-barrel fold metal-dependent hydrolase